MSAPKREQFANNAVTSLNGGIDASQTTITVADASVFPSTGNFRIIIETELLLVTAIATNDLTVVRGIEGSTGASHSDSAVVTHVVTDTSLNRWLQDSLPLAGDSSTAPPLNKLVGTDGATLLTSSDFTWFNQGGASVADLLGTMCLRVPPSSGNNIRGLVRSVPSAPWTLITAIKAVCFADDGGTQNPQIAVCLRESGTGKLYSFCLNRNNTTSLRFALDKWTNETTFSATPWRVTNPIFHGDVLWMKIVDNNTNLLFSLSNDGVEWTQVYSESRTTFMAGAPNQFGISINNGSNASGLDSLIRLLHFHTE